MPACPTSANNSYPVLPPSTDTTNYNDLQTLYNRLSTTTPINLNFGSRATPPNFVTLANALLDDNTLTNLPTIRYSSKTYTFQYGQITKPYNTRLIPVVANQLKNIADLTLVFKTDQTITNINGDSKYIFISIPLLEVVGYANDPAYILGLAGTNTDGPFSLEQCITENFLTYSTCLNNNGPTNNADANINALVLVFYDGCSISKTSFDLLKQILGKTTFNNVILTDPVDCTIGANGVFSSTGTGSSFTPTFTTSSLATNTITNIKTEKVNPTNAYKCVPLDIAATKADDGSITIDTTKGTPVRLNKVLATAKTVVDSVQPRIDYNKMMAAVGGFFAIFCLLLGIFSALWGLQFFNKITPAEYEIVKPYILYSAIAVIFSMVGFFIGSYIPK
jgi:hypothetical protein